MPIEAHAKPLKEIFSAPYWFSIPVYQRPYLWGKEEILELLDDIYDAYGDKSTEYFLGSIVLLKNKDEYEVLDGQQRLTTLFIVYTVLSKIFKNTKHENNLLNKIHQQADVIDNIPEIIRIKYEREEANKKIKEIITDNYNADHENSKIIEDKSAKDIVKAFKIIKDYLTDRDKFRSEDDLVKFATFLSVNTTVIDVSADTQIEAFKLFSILNNRGIPLRGADILKAENIGALAPNEKQSGIHDWENFENNLQDDELDNFLQFIRTIYLKSKQESSLLDEFEKKIYGANLLQKGMETINALNNYYNIYDIILCNKNINLTKYEQLIRIMQKYIKSKDWIPPLMYFYNEFINDISSKHDAQHLLDFLKKLEYKFVGDWISGEKPAARRNAMYAILKKIEEVKKQNLTAKDVINDKTLFNVDIKKLHTALTENIYGENYATYVLLKLEYLCADESVNTEYKRISIEHILPQIIEKDCQWSKDFNEEERNYWTHRFANLILLGPTKNQTLRNSDFHEKKDRYSRTKGIDKFTITKYTLEGTKEWTPAILEKRQKSLIDFFINNKPIFIDGIKASVTLD